MVRYSKIFVFIFLLLGTTQWCIAQESTATAGSEATGTTGTVSFSVGLVDYVTINGANTTSSQGVQQAFEIFTVTSTNTPKPAFNLSLYPNPTTNFITLSVDTKHLKNLSYKVYDISGKQIALQKISTATTNITMANLPASTYFVQVFSPTTKIKTFKVVKH